MHQARTARDAGAVPRSPRSGDGAGRLAHRASPWPPSPPPLARAADGPSAPAGDGRPARHHRHAARRRGRRVRTRRAAPRPGSTAWPRAASLFRHAHAHNVVTLPSHANILSGRLPFEHGVRDNAGFRFPKGHGHAGHAALGRAGYRTGAFVSAFTLDSRFGLDRGFDVYDDHFADGAAPSAFVLPERPGADTVAAARGRGSPRATAGRRSPGSTSTIRTRPYRPPEPFASRFAGEPYLGDVAAADAALEPLLAPLLDARRDGRPWSS